MSGVWVQVQGLQLPQAAPDHVPHGAPAPDQWGTWGSGTPTSPDIRSFTHPSGPCNQSPPLPLCRSGHQLNFFLFPFCEKSMICLEGKSMTPHRGNTTHSLPFLSATPSSPSQTFGGLFDLTRRPSRALDLPCALLPELQINKDTVRCTALIAEIPGHR